MEGSLFRDIVVIFGLAVGVIWVCHILRLPVIVGLLITGIISGPHGLGFVEDITDVEMLAEVGIMLLLFTIGMEFSLKRLLQIKRYFFVGGIVQVGLTVLVGFLIGQLISLPLGESLFLGFLLSMSSTAIVLKSMEKQDAADSPFGRMSIGILIFQDIVAVPFMLLIPLLGAGKEDSPPVDLLVESQLLIGVLLIALVFFAAIKVVPRLLYHLARVRSRELFSLSVLAICFAVAWLSSHAGLSMALGAFLAGLIISESEYRYEAIGHILPLQDIFSSLFFVSIGMVLDVNFVYQQPFTILFVAIGVMILKGIIVGVAALCLGLPLSVMISAGFALSQIGEFAFVLAKAGSAANLGTDYQYQLFLAVSLLTMALTPLLIGFAPRIVQFFMKLPLPEKLKMGFRNKEPEEKPKLSGHIVIIGYGLTGRNLVRASKDANLPYMVVEMNPETVKKEMRKGEPIHFGDASHESVLQHVNIEAAKAVAIVINDINAVRRIIRVVRSLNPSAYLIIRTRYVQDAKGMYELGADDVIPDELGTSVEVFVRVLNHYAVPQEDLDMIVTGVRAESSQTLRTFAH